MDEIAQWFENEFGYLGFSVTPTLYDPNTFEPHKGVLFCHPQVNGGHVFKTRIRIVSGLVNDLNHVDIVDEIKILLRESVIFILEEHGLNINGVKDFKPKQKINKLIL
jgi:hypothetical protein